MACIYVADTSSIIELAQYYPEKVFPQLWRNFQILVTSGRLLAPTEVFKEIELGKNLDLIKWCKKNQRMFIENNREIAGFVTQIIQQHPGLVNANKLGPEADPFIIALARSRKSNLTNSEPIVVTQEGHSSLHKIPFVCSKYDINCIKLIDVFHSEGWQF